jgi:glutathione S-transferase
MLKIYHAPGTRGIRVIWLCHELNLPIEVEMIDFSIEWRSRAEWREISPLGKVPVLFDGATKMFESVAMVEYILAKYADGALQPEPGSAAHAEYLQWHWFAEATFSRPLGEIVNHGREFPGEKRIDAVVAEMANRGVLAGQMVADHMQNRTYLLGETFTAADISMGYTIMLLENFVAEKFPEGLRSYWDRLRERPAFQQAIGNP